VIKPATTPQTHEDAMKQNTTRLNLEQLETRFVLSTVNPIRMPVLNDARPAVTVTSFQWGIGRAVASEIVVTKPTDFVLTSTVATVFLKYTFND
jgi:hypothetical protein